MGTREDPRGPTKTASNKYEARIEHFNKTHGALGMIPRGLTTLMAAEGCTPELIQRTIGEISRYVIKQAKAMCAARCTEFANNRNLGRRIDAKERLKQLKKG